MEPEFKDNFSKQSDIYVKYRPSYPAELFTYLSSLTTEHKQAWDCGTGNGQSAVGLAAYYDQVIATDPSEKQLGNAITHPRIIYKKEQAEKTSIEDNSTDIVTVSQALHWFDFEKFYLEVNRVLKKDGIIAAWSYTLPVITPGLDNVLKHFHDIVLHEFWLNENKLIDKEYKTIPFPFDQITTPGFEIKKELLFNDLTGLLYSWSAVQKFKDKFQKDPVQELVPELRKCWPDKHESKIFTWKLLLKAGKKTFI